MIDFLIVVTITLACTVAVRRVRRLGFEGLQPNVGVTSLLRRWVLAPPARRYAPEAAAEQAAPPARDLEGPIDSKRPSSGGDAAIAEAAPPLARPSRPRARPWRLVSTPSWRRARAPVWLAVGLLVAAGLLLTWQLGGSASSRKLEDVTLADGRELAPAGTIKQPRGVAVSPSGTLFIADADTKGVVALPLTGGTPRFLASGELREPSAVAVAPDQTLIVLDGGAGAIWRLDPDTGALLDRIAPEAGLYGPRGVAVAPDGRIAIADTGNNRVLVFPPGEGAPQILRDLREPTDVAFLADGFLVAATGERRVVALKQTGERQRSWDIPVAYTVTGPHLAVIPGSGSIATTPEEGALLRISADGSEYQRVSLGGPRQKPVGIVMTPAGLVVTDSEGGRVTLYGNLRVLNM